MKKLLIVIGLLFGFLIPATPASAADFGFTEAAKKSSTVYVTENLPASWDVKKALAFVDKYTGTKFKLVSKCPANSSCLRIRNGAVKGGSNSSIGWTNGMTITIDVKDASKSGQFGPKTRTWLLVHEIGHNRGLGHRKSCVTSMYQYRRCGGHVPPLYFDSSQRVTLKKH